MRYFFYVMVVCLGFLLSACDQSSSEKTDYTAEVSAPITNPYLSADGERITLKADNLTQHQILTFMSQQLGFEVKFIAPLDKTVSVNVSSVTLREALQNVLSGNPYSVTLLYQSQVDFFPKIVTIALDGKSALSEPSQQSSAPTTANTPQVISPLPEDKDKQNQGMKQFQEKILANNTPVATELSFLDGMTGTKEDAGKVAPMLQDPKVSSDDKEAIIDMLQNGEHDDVIAPLKTALQDKDPEVVKAAIEAIVFLGDEADVDTLKKLRDSTKDDDIRQAADDGITFLE